MWEVRLAGKECGSDSQQRCQIDDDRHLDDADMSMGMLHAQYPLTPVGHDTVAQGGDANRSEVPDQDDGQHAGFGMVRFAAIVFVEGRRNHGAEHNMQRMGKFKQGLGSLRIKYIRRKPLHGEQEGRGKGCTQKGERSVMPKFVENN